MQQDITQLEIMAPVGSRESLTAAIQAGANSVYFGIGQLNTTCGRLPPRAPNITSRAI